jgi:hypothetical protein
MGGGVPDTSHCPLNPNVRILHKHVRRILNNSNFLINSNVCFTLNFLLFFIFLSMCINFEEIVTEPNTAQHKWPHFETRIRLGENKNLGHGSRAD